MSDLYPQETASFNALPNECPITFLDYGILTEKITDKVVTFRQKERTKRKDELIDKLKLKYLKGCLYQLDLLSRMSQGECKPIIDLWKKKHLVSSKKKIKTFLDNNFVPLIYLTEAYEKQQNKVYTFKIGDRVKCIKLRYQSYPRCSYKRAKPYIYYGVVSQEIKEQKEPKYIVNIVKVREYKDEEDNVISYPDFSELIYTYETWSDVLYMYGWELEKIGEENLVSTRLREKKDYIIKREKLWEKMKPLLLNIYNVLDFTNIPKLSYNRDLLISKAKHHDNDLSDDELFERGVMKEIEEQIIPCYKKLWFLDIVDVLDKNTWENLDDETNPLNKLFYIDGIELKALKDAKIMARTIKEHHLLYQVSNYKYIVP